MANKFKGDRRNQCELVRSEIKAALKVYSVWIFKYICIALTSNTTIVAVPRKGSGCMLWFSIPNDCGSHTDPVG